MAWFRLGCLAAALGTCVAGLCWAAERGDRFAELDTDGDGKLSAEEVGKPLLFGKMDLDGDGFVRREEAGTYLYNEAQRRKNLPDPPAMPPMTKHLNVPYYDVDGVDPALLSLDIYAPKDAKARPVMVMIHGGGWRGGDKGGAGMTHYKVPHFVGDGWVYVSINYRLSPAVRHPVHVQDVARALAWVHDNIARYGGDPKQLHIMGHSAGAHLAALVSVDERRLKAEGKDLSIIRSATILDCGAIDVPRSLELGLTRPMQAMYEQAFGKTVAEQRDASPRYFVAKGKGIPPMLFLRSGGQRRKMTLVEDMVAALRKACVPGAVLAAPDLDHAGVNWTIGMPGSRYSQAVMEFLGAPASVGEIKRPEAEQPSADPERRRSVDG